MYRIFNTQNAFYFIYNINQELRNVGVITYQDEMLCNSFISETKNIYDDIMREIVNFSLYLKYDIDFYKRLFELEDKHLFVTYISPDDPFYPLFGLVKRCLEEVSELLNMIIHEVSTENMPKLTKDKITFSILNNMKNFFDDLRLSSFNTYTLKQQENNIGVKISKKIRIKINEIIYERTRAYQMYLQTILNPILKKTPAYESMVNSYESLLIDFKLSGMEIHSDSCITRIDQEQDTKPNQINLYVNKGSDQNYQDNLKSETSLEERIMLHDIQYPENGFYTVCSSIFEDRVNRTDNNFPHCIFSTILATLAIVLFIFFLIMRVF